MMNERNKNDKLSALGADISGRTYVGSYIQKNENIVRIMVKELLRKNNVLLMDLADAVDKLPWVKDYLWRAINPEEDNYVSEVSERKLHGTLLYVPPQTVITLPIQLCFFISESGVKQDVHNIIVLDKYSEITLNTTCAAIAGAAFHLGITEIYVKSNAKLNYVMIHGWSPDTFVRPRTGSIVERGGMLNMYYANLKPVRDIQTCPKIILKENAVANTISVLLGLDESIIRVGSKIVLDGKGAKGEVLSRAIAQDESKVIMPAEVDAYYPNTKGHIDCKGLQLSKDSYIESIPILKSFTEGSELTHEATIGKLSEEGLNYLMSKGFSEEEAVSLLVRGFIDVGLKYLPVVVRPQVEIALNIIAKTAKG